MRKPMAAAIIVILFALCAPAHAEDHKTRVEMQTSLGNIVIDLDAESAPKTVENFLAYVRSGFYDNTIFHRVIKGFMIQGGGLTQDMQKKKTLPPIPNEADNGLKNKAGTIAMARTGQPHSATSQFFINVADNPFLDHKSKSQNGWGYCVFGRVIQGMDIVKKIEAVQTGFQAGRRDVPKEPVVIRTVSVSTGQKDKPENPQ